MRAGCLALSGIVAVILTACGDDGSSPPPPPALQISTRTPAPGAMNVETGAVVTVTFNQAIDPATLTAATFLVKVGGVALPVALTYDAATQTARAAAPLLPDSTYDVEVTTGVRTPADSALGASSAWSFATRAWQTVSVDATVAVGVFTSLALDGSGRLHVSYYNVTNRDLRYATCAAACAAAANWQTVTVDSLGDVGPYSSLAVGGSGQLFVSYSDASNGDLKVATCLAACATAANWQTVAVDTTGNVGTFTSMAAEGSGRFHVSYQDASNADLKYATCAAACVTVANWQAVTVDSAGSVGQYSSLAVDGSGRLHVSYNAPGDLKYATCPGACATAANWQTVTADATGNVGDYTSLVADASGRPHVTYYDATTSALKYANCAAACATGANWQVVAVDTAGTVGQFTSLVMDQRGRVHVGYFAFTNFDLKYATCATACTTAANWRVVIADATGDVGRFTSLAVNGSGRLHMSYTRTTGNGLMYIE